MPPHFKLRGTGFCAPVAAQHPELRKTHRGRD
jgi:hypothetical protein